jgi:SAM-dependent methyltransferase
MKAKLINEGIGGAYERIAYSNVIKKIAKENNCSSILELGATFIAGVPGFNSCLLAQDGFDVTVTVHSRDYEETCEAWQSAGFKNNAEIIRWDKNLATNFNDNQFDLVCNHLAFEHYKYPEKLVEEMKRISNNVIINLTLSPWNIGFSLHWLAHHFQKKKWDHGYFKNTLLSTMEKTHQEAGLELLESGGCDVPPWMDTVDAQMGGTMTYFDYAPKFVKNNWIWNSALPECQNHWLVKLLWDWEKNFPEWFRRATAHHLYTASAKKSFD